MSANHVHKHGTSTCYIHCKCRCVDCRARNTEREARRTRLKAYGRWTSPWVPAEPVRKHVQTLTAAGLGQKQIAKLAGIRYGAIQNLLYGRQQPGPRHLEQLQNMSRQNANLLLALIPDPAFLAGGARVSPKGARRRLRALVALGWSQSKLADLLGVNRGNFSALMFTNKTITARSARAVTELYQQVSNTLPPHTSHRDKIAFNRTRRYAAEHGWPLPMDWEAIDNEFDGQRTVRRSAA